MVACSIGILNLIKHQEVVDPDITQPWYSNNTGALGMFDNLKLYFDSLKCNGPVRGYYPDSTIIIMIVYLDNLEA